MGVILYEMTTGRLPFEAKSIYDLIVKHATEQPPAARTRRADLPEAVEAVIMRCLEKSPDDRYATAEDLRDAWEKAWNGAPPEAPRVPTIGKAVSAVSVPTPLAREMVAPASPPASSGRAYLAIGVVVLALVAVGAFALGGGTTPASAPPTTTSAAPTTVAEIAAPPTTVAELAPPPATTEADPTRTIASEPAGATVEVDGAAIGTTPIALTLTHGEPVAITLRMAGRRSTTRTITTADPETVTIEMERAGGARPHGDLPTLAPH
jgi:serine/threonine-protein kinase